MQLVYHIQREQLDGLEPDDLMNLVDSILNEAVDNNQYEVSVVVSGKLANLFITPQYPFMHTLDAQFVNGILVGLLWSNHIRDYTIELI